MGVIGGVDLLLELDRDDLGQDAIVEDLIFKDTINLFYSEPGAGKSVIAINMMASMSRGEPVFGIFKMKAPVKCSYLQLEGSRVEQLGRLKSIREVIYFNAMNIAWHNTPLFVESNESQNIVFKELLEQKPEVIFIDSLYCLTGQGLSNEKGFLAVRQLIQTIKSKTNATIIILHHSAKAVYHEGEKVNVADPFLGSQYLKAFLDFSMLIKRIDKNRVEMKVTKESRNAEAVDKIVLTFSKSNWIVNADMNHTSIPAHLLIKDYVLEKFKKGVFPTTSMIANDLSFSVRHILRLKSDGYFDNVAIWEDGGKGKGNKTVWKPKSLP